MKFFRMATLVFLIGLSQQTFAQGVSINLGSNSGLYVSSQAAQTVYGSVYSWRLLRQGSNDYACCNQGSAVDFDTPPAEIVNVEEEDFGSDEQVQRECTIPQPVALAFTPSGSRINETESARLYDFLTLVASQSGEGCEVGSLVVVVQACTACDHVKDHQRLARVRGEKIREAIKHATSTFPDLQVLSGIPIEIKPIVVGNGNIGAVSKTARVFAVAPGRLGEAGH